MKFKVTWWFLDAIEGIRRGTDIIEAPEDFEEDVAEDLLNREMECNLDSKPKTKNFYKNAVSPEPMKWGVLRVVRINKEKKLSEEHEK